MSAISSEPIVGQGPIPQEQQKIYDPEVNTFAKAFFGSIAGGAAAVATSGLSLLSVGILKRAGIAHKFYECIQEGKPVKEVFQEFKALPLYAKVALIAVSAIAVAGIGWGILGTFTAPMPITAYPGFYMILGLFGASQGSDIACNPEETLPKKW